MANAVYSRRLISRWPGNPWTFELGHKGGMAATTGEKAKPCRVRQKGIEKRPESWLLLRSAFASGCHHSGGVHFFFTRETELGFVAMVFFTLPLFPPIPYFTPHVMHDENLRVGGHLLGDSQPTHSLMEMDPSLFVSAALMRRSISESLSLSPSPLMISASS